jgi:serine/threonine protein kinase
MWFAAILRARQSAHSSEPPTEAARDPGLPSSPVSAAAPALPMQDLLHDAATQRSPGAPPAPDSTSEHPALASESREVAVLSPISGETEAAPESRGLPRPGDLVGDTFEVVSEIGRGSMGVVLSAFDRKLERPVAIKLIRAELLDSGFRQRFLDEARVMAQINHPNVVCIHALGEHGAMPYFVMELVEGMNLEQWQRRRGGPVELRPALEILNDMCLGVSAIHEAGAVHRDLKPSNILLDAQLRSRVADFGVSTRTEGSDRAGVAGTPGYMAPEVVLAAGEGLLPLPQSDVYSLGCIAYQLLTGVHPFRRSGDTGAPAVPPPAHALTPPSSIRPDLPPAFDRVILQALAWDVASRTPSVDIFRRGLLGALEGENTPERVLVAEDDHEFCELIQLRLRQEFPDADIECVDDGVAALAALERRPASVALVDLQMPGMDGATLTAQLRRRTDCSGMPIIVLTASGGAREWQRLSSMGADRFLVKPIQLDDVVTFIRQALRERGRRSLPPPARPSAPQHG